MSIVIDEGAAPSPQREVSPKVAECAKAVGGAICVVLFERGIDYRPTASVQIVGDWIQKCVDEEVARVRETELKKLRAAANLVLGSFAYRPGCGPEWYEATREAIDPR